MARLPTRQAEMFGLANKMMLGVTASLAVVPIPPAQNDGGKREMTTRDVLLKEIQQVPEPLLHEILDFIRFVQVRGAGGRFETAVVSEPSLSKDWLRPEEDAAWHDL